MKIIERVIKILVSKYRKTIRTKIFSLGTTCTFDHWDKEGNGFRAECYNCAYASAFNDAIKKVLNIL